MAERTLSWATAGMPMPGEAKSGDAAVVVDTDDGTWLAMVDGLGHGPEATYAATVAIDTFTGHVHGGSDFKAPLRAVFRDCHEALKATRGVAMTLVAIDREGWLRWAGVGNVDAALVRARPDGGRQLEAAFTFGGVVGYQLPNVDEHQLQVARGDLLVMATDGVRRGYLDTINIYGPLQPLADSLLAKHGTERDDALVLLARFEGAR